MVNLFARQLGGLMDDMYKKALIQARKERELLGLPNSPYSFESEGSVYSGNTGGSGFQNLMMKEVKKELTPEEIFEISRKNAIQELIRKKAMEELKNENFNFYGNKV